MQDLEGALQFGPRKHTQFTYCGVRVAQKADRSIELDQDEYIQKMAPMPVKHLADGPLRAKELRNFKAHCGTLAWPPVTNTRPQRAFDVSWIASKSTAPTKADMLQANKSVRRVKFEPQRRQHAKVAPAVSNWCLVSCVLPRCRLSRSAKHVLPSGGSSSTRPQRRP